MFLHTALTGSIGNLAALDNIDHGDYVGVVEEAREGDACCRNEDCRERRRDAALVRIIPWVLWIECFCVGD